MDSQVPSDKVTQELARHLLIAISYTVPDTVPDTDLNTDNASKNIDGANWVAVATTDGAEQYRSELISISYDQSPDAQVPPVVLGNHLGY